MGAGVLASLTFGPRLPTKILPLAGACDPGRARWYLHHGRVVYPVTLRQGIHLSVNQRAYCFAGVKLASGGTHERAQANVNRKIWQPREKTHVLPQASRGEAAHHS
jgi:hypothetical protein